MGYTYPERTPKAVRQAVQRYRQRRLLVSVCAVLCAGLGGAVLAALGFIVADRFAEWPLAARQAGPLLCLLMLATTIVAMARALLHRESARAIALHLDQALPGSDDRLGTALDLAVRVSRGETVGDETLVARLYADTEAQTDSAAAASVVDTHWLRVGVAVLVVAATGVIGLQVSPVFNLPLLTARFCQPTANLPRDSNTRIRIVSATTLPDGADLTDLSSATLCTIPQGDPFDLVLALSARDGSVPKVVPQVELLAADGSVVSVDCVPEDARWTYTSAALAAPLRCRLRAGDALSQTFLVAIKPRIRISAFEYAVRHPTYTRRPPEERALLATERLSLLAGSRLEFFVTCDQAIAEISAVFELLDSDGGGAAALTAKEQWQRGRAQSEDKLAAAEKQRQLRVKKRRDGTANFRLRVDTSGILRLRVTGENGLDSGERVCLIESTRDAPPRITVSGLEPNTYIVPGETVSYQYHAEDDLAVSDLYMDWTTAGSARTHDLAGEEYISSPDFGKQIVTGSRQIQRMNYKVYGTTPFAFTLIVTDSKGQESRSDSYRIHLLRDTHAARFATGMQFYTVVERAIRLQQGRGRELLNQLNIITAAVGERNTWPPGQQKLIDNFARTSAGIGFVRSRDLASHYYSGWPSRLQYSVSLLLATLRSADSGRDFRALFAAARASDDVAAGLATLKARLQREQAYLKVVHAAVAGERQRFAGEAVLQRLRNVSQRMVRLDAQPAGSSQLAADLAFYQDEVRKIAAAAVGVSKQVPELAEPAAALTAAATGDPAAMRAAIAAARAVLLAEAPPLSPQLTAALATAHARAATDPTLARRLRRGLAEAVYNREAEAASAPLADLALARLWMAEQPLPPDWYQRPTVMLDLWLLAERLANKGAAHHRDQQLRRFSLDAAAGDDQAAHLREEAILLLDLAERCPPLTAADREAAAAAAGPVIAGAVDARAVAALQALRDRWAAAGQAGLAAHAGQVPADLAAQGAALRRLNDAYAAHADATAAGRAGRGQAEALQAGPRVVELAFRTTLYLHIRHALATDAAWAHWRPWYAVQLMVLLDGRDGFAKVSHRHTGKGDQTVVATAAREFGVRLREHGEQLELLRNNQPLTTDVQQLMRESRTLGYLRNLESELLLLRPLLTADAAVRKEGAAQVRSSRQGAVVLREHALATLLGQAEKLAAPGVTAAAAADVLARVSQALPEDEGIPGLQPLLTQLQRLPAADRGRPLSADAQRRLSVVRQAIADVETAMSDAVRLPPVAMKNRANVRFQDRAAREFWPIAGVIHDFDRRWLRRLRDAELNLVRALVAAGRADAGAAEQVQLTAAYGALVALRARQVAHESRRNSGISFLDEDEGPSLKLPPHIAREFLRARNRRGPAQFAANANRYFEQLFNDMAR
jgi:hypothetical protein